MSDDRSSGADLMGARRTITDLLEAARVRLDRLDPAAAYAAIGRRWGDRRRYPLPRSSSRGAAAPAHVEPRGAREGPLRAPRRRVGSCVLVFRGVVFRSSSAVAIVSKAWSTVVPFASAVRFMASHVPLIPGLPLASCAHSRSYDTVLSPGTLTTLRAAPVTRWRHSTGPAGDPGEPPRHRRDRQAAQPPVPGSSRK